MPLQQFLTEFCTMLPSNHFFLIRIGPSYPEIRLVLLFCAICGILLNRLLPQCLPIIWQFMPSMSAMSLILECDKFSKLDSTALVCDASSVTEGQKSFAEICQELQTSKLCLCVRRFSSSPANVFRSQVGLQCIPVVHRHNYTMV